MTFSLQIVFLDKSHYSETGTPEESKNPAIWAQLGSGGHFSGLDYKWLCEPEIAYPNTKEEKANAIDKMLAQIAEKLKSEVFV